MRRYLPLWIGLLRLSWRHQPRLSALCLATRVLDIAAFAGTGLATRAAVDAAGGGAVRLAVAGAIGAAVAYAATGVLGYAALSFRRQVVERVGLTVLEPEILRAVSRVEHIDHLERPDFLDRVTVLRGAAWGIVDSAWAAVEAALNVARLVVILVLLGTVSPWLFPLLAVAAGPLWFDRRGARCLSRAETDSAELVRLQRHLFDLAVDPVAGREIRVTAAGPRLARMQGAAWDEAAQLRLRAHLAAAAWKAGGWLFFTAGFAAGLCVVAYQASTGRSTPGDVVLTIAVATNLRNAIRQTVSRSNDMLTSGRLLDPYLWLCDYVAAQQPPPGRLAAPAVLRDGITLTAVSYSYPGTARRAVDRLSVRLPAGSVVAVVGEYGSGKTTLVKLLCKLHRPDSGLITVDGADLARIDTQAWRSRLSVAFQDFGRYKVLLRETVGLGDVSRIDDSAYIGAVLDSVDATQFVSRLPDGIDTPLGQEFGGAELSEGQWQKTALARASMRTEPVLFVLDEPTASLDAPSEDAIFRRYFARARSLAEGTGAVTVVVSHRFSTVSGADLILVLEKGRLAESGTHASLLARGGVYAQLYAIQADAYADDPASIG